MSHPPLVTDLLAGSRRALARALTIVENNTDDAAALLADLYPHTGSAHLIGITGAPGTGKSTLVNRLALEYRQRGRTVAIVAVDPTSPFSGGAILGDRIRMQDLHGDKGVFIRSMATRGSLGGLARTTGDMVTVFDAAGYDVILIETVGAGQSEVEVARLAQSIAVVEAPGLGDDVQAIKAGILEIADILVVNKSDDPRAKNTVRALRTMLDLGHPPDRGQMLHHGQLVEVHAPPAPPPEDDHWDVLIQPTTATTGEGVLELADHLDAHYRHIAASGELDRRERTRALTDLESRLRDALVYRLLAATPEDQITHLIDQIVARRLTPAQAVGTLLENVPITIDENQP